MLNYYFNILYNKCRQFLLVRDCIKLLFHPSSLFFFFFLINLIAYCYLKNRLQHQHSAVDKCKFPGNNFVVIGSLNGLFCLEITQHTGYKSVCVCNPFLDEYITIPITSKKERHRISLGFGISALSKQYKVIQLFCYGKNYKWYGAETYTIDTGQRRSVGNAPSKVCRLDRYGGAFLHGSLHTVHYYFGPNGFLCVFDFESEQYRQFPLPLQCSGDRVRR